MRLDTVRRTYDPPLTDVCLGDYIGIQTPSEVSNLTIPPYHSEGNLNAGKYVIESPIANCTSDPGSNSTPHPNAIVHTGPGKDEALGVASEPIPFQISEYRSPYPPLETSSSGNPFNSPQGRELMYPLGDGQEPEASGMSRTHASHMSTQHPDGAGTPEDDSGKEFTTQETGAEGPLEDFTTLLTNDSENPTDNRSDACEIPS